MTSSERFLISVALMSATIMQVLDMTITNVALPHMAGSLGAGIDSIPWVLTSYIVGASVIMPLTGYFTDRLGRRRFLLASIGGFVVASGLCGLATNLAEMVVFRLLQGMFGAALVPLSQAVMAETYPLEERGKAMAIWGMGVMVAPIMGPTLGGYLTESFSWRWTFYINLPVGILSWFLAARYIPDTVRRERRMDWLGLTLLATAVCALQLVLDRGEQDDWFASRFIVGCALAAAASFGGFVWHTLQQRGHPLFDLAVLKDRNFALACTVIAAMGIGLFGAQLLQPLFLENYLGYPASEAGLYIMPRGIATLFSMMAVGKLSGRVSPKVLVGCGMAVSIAGSYLMTAVSPQAGGRWMIVPLALQGFGMGFIFVPMATLAFSSIARAAAAEAAGIYSLVRSVGSAIGISLVSSYLSRAAQAHWELLRGAFTPYRGAVEQYLGQLHATSGSPLGTQMLAQVLGRQAQLAAFVDCFWLVTASFVAMLPLLLFMRSARPGKAAPDTLVAE